MTITEADIQALRERTDPLDVPELVTLALYVAQTWPDNVNPMDETACLYTALDDPERHCFVGQMVTVMGWPLPAPSAGPAGFQVAAMRWPVRRYPDYHMTAMNFLDSLQTRADGLAIGQPKAQPVAWGTLTEAIKTYQP